jgi:hypothetical protein
MKRCALTFCLILAVLLGCSDPAAENAAIDAVKNARTGIQGRTTLQLLTDFAVISQTTGNSIEPKGWMATKDPSTGAYKVLFLLQENGKKLRYEWLVSEGKAAPLNKLAEQITPPGL